MAMRLIDTRSLQLKTFVGSSIPRYAILSHTWAADTDEITFQDMSAINEGSKAKTERYGYRKISEACEKARSDGIDYCWVDTCCIDKTSSSELSEAINSMYKWYRDADICYVLLSDYNDQDKNFLLGSEKCRWFTRGWCLQELVAPRRIMFCDRGWNSLGSRDELAPFISKITLIDIDVLNGQTSMESLPIAQRLSWAAERVTTREEDIAYCLLGIFDIQMPILYGEGTKAFIRLQEEIMKRSNDLSLFATEPPSKHRKLQGEPSYIDLLATSPQDFAHCSSLRSRRKNWVQNSAYALTNKGLHFSEIQLKLDMSCGVYILPLNCGPGNALGEYELYLRQVTRDLFVRCDMPEYRHLFWHKVRWVVKRDIYIVAHLSHSIHSHLDTLDEYAIQVSGLEHTRGDTEVVRAVEGLSTSSRWDPIRMQFSTQGSTSFVGCLQFWAEEVWPIFTDRPRASLHGCCYLICALEWEDPTMEPTASLQLIDQRVPELRDSFNIPEYLEKMRNASIDRIQAGLLAERNSNLREPKVAIVARMALDRQSRKYIINLDCKENGMREIRLPNLPTTIYPYET